MDRWSRIIVDSRHRTADSLSNSHFSVDLPWPVTVPAGTKAHIDAVQFSHVWGTVQEGVNDRLYLTEKLESTVGSTLRQTLSRLAPTTRSSCAPTSRRSYRAGPRSPARGQ